jgi:hypothetical protein
MEQAANRAGLTTVDPVLKALAAQQGLYLTEAEAEAARIAAAETADDDKGRRGKRRGGW